MSIYASDIGRLFYSSHLHYCERRWEGQHSWPLNQSLVHNETCSVTLPFDTISAIIKTETMGHVNVLY